MWSADLVTCHIDIPTREPDGGHRKARSSGAGDENRTRTTSLEGWGSTIELHPREAGSCYRPTGRGMASGGCVSGRDVTKSTNQRIDE